MTNGDKIIAALVVLLGVFALSFLMSLPVMLLWNYALVGAVNSVNEIGWLQAWGITILCGFLFKTNINMKD